MTELINNQQGPTTKQELIDLTISLFGEEGENYLYTRGTNLQRDLKEVFLIDDFYEFVRQRHPNFDRRDIEEILEQIKDDSKPLQAFNKYFFQVLREGLPYRRIRDDTIYPVNLIDFKDFENNIFRVADEIPFSATKIDYEYKHAMSNEIDLIIYINGLPLFVWEFNPPRQNQESKDELLLNALQSMEYNQKLMPELFRYNAFCVICSGLQETKYGISWGEYKDYKEWKRVFEGDINLQKGNILLTTIKGLFRKWRIIEILDAFICFSDTDANKKIICRYPQYFGATKLLKSIEGRCKNNKNDKSRDGKGGVYFGATGCGKSYTMLFLSKLLLSSPEMNRPTILLITDRIALNYQLSKLFRDYKEYLQCEEIVRIDNDKNPLRQTINGSISGGIYLTTIQKFRSINGVLSDKWNFVCISDEAHRTQDSLGGKYKTIGEKLKQSKALAQLLHESLPNATYVGFTATPRDQTLDAFGGIVDVYGMPQSVKDGFTVQILAEWRETKLKLDESIARQIDNIYAEMAESHTPKEKIQDDQERRVRWRKTLSSPKVLEVIAREIIDHYERRVQDKTTSGKAMIVVDSREAACVIYKIFQRLRPEWFEEKDSLFPERSMVNLVISYSDLDPEIIKSTIGEVISHSKLANEFKKEKSSFKIAIVCGMWLTGFDVPSLDTMYLNKYIQGHELIQAISRVNRSYESKEYKKDSGLVVFYVPLKKKLKEAGEALEGMGGGSGIINMDEIVNELIEKLQILNNRLSIFVDWDIDTFFKLDELGKWTYINNTVDWLKEQDSEYREDIFIKLKEIKKRYQKCMSYDSFQRNKDCREQVMLYDIIFSFLRNPSRAEKIKGKEIDELMKQAFSVKSIQRGGIDDAINLHSNYNIAKKEEPFFPPLDDEYEERLTPAEERWIKQISVLKEQGSVGKSMAERLKALIEKYNSAWDELERKEIQKKIQELEKEIETFSKEEQARKREEWRKNLILNKVLMPIKNKYQFDFSEEKMKEMSAELKKIGDKYSSFIDWENKTTIQSRLKRELNLFFRKNDWPPELEDEEEAPYEILNVIYDTRENLLFVFKNFPSVEKGESEEKK